MTMRNRTLLSVFVGGMAGVLLSACGSAQPHGSSTRSTAPTASSSLRISRLQTFIGQPLPPRITWYSGNGFITARVAGVGLFGEDPSTGDIVTVTYDLPNPLPTQLVSQQTALATAENFAAHHGGLSGMPLVRSSRDDHGVASEYTFDWRAHKGIALLPTYTEVSVLAEGGTVSGYVHVAHDLLISTVPSVSAVDAAKRARSVVANGAPSSVSEPQLVVEQKRDGSQELVWELEITATAPRSAVPNPIPVWVDAKTGQVTQPSV